MGNKIQYFIVILAVFVATLTPTISAYRDSGGLVAAALTLGIAHPTGYPLYVLLGRAFITLVPLGNIAYRINLMSAVFGALTVVLLLKTFKGRHGLIFCALAFVSSFWRLSVVSEMYTINTFFTVLILFLVSKSLEDNESSLNYLYCAAFVCGLASGNHMTIVFLLPGMLLVAYYLRKRIINKKIWLLFFILFGFAGFSVNFYLPVRGFFDPAIEWGESETLRGFFRTITRADYGGLKLHPTESKFVWDAAGILEQLLLHFRLLLERFTVIIFALGAFGVVKNIKNKIVIFSLLTFFVSGPLFTLLANLPIDAPSTPGILEPHFLMSDIFLVVFSYYGLISISKRTIINIVAFGCVAVVFVLGFKQCNYRYDFFAYDYGRNLLATMPKNSMLYDPDDPTAFIIDYLDYAERSRRDIKIAKYFRTRWGYERLRRKYPELLPPRTISSGVELARVLIEYNKDKREIFSELPGKFPTNIISHPHGLLFRVGEKRKDINPFEFYATRGNFNFAADKDFFTGQVVSYYASALTNSGLWHFQAGDKAIARKKYLAALGFLERKSAAWNNFATLEFHSGNYEKAAYLYLKALEYEPENISTIYNLGITYRKLNNLDLAEKMFRDILLRDYSPSVASDLGLLLFEVGRFAEAEAEFEKILRNYPDFGPARYNLAFINIERNPSKANMHFRIYLERFATDIEKPEIKEIISNLSH